MIAQRPQQTFMTPLLVGTDGCHKMSKSLGNYIGVSEPPNQMYGKVMSVPDTLILNYFELLTDVPDEELDSIKRSLESNAVNPMNLKKRLASEIVGQLHGKEAARQAEEEFTKVFQKREAPEEIKEVAVSFREFSSEPSGTDISKLLAAAGQVKSRSEASRLIGQGAISIDGEKVTDSRYLLRSGSIIKMGKHRFVKIINTDK
jgi:tyrosyl-tRNA synthetase